MLDFSGHRYSPVTNVRVPVSGGFDPVNMFQVVQLDDYGWSSLHESITFGVRHNTNPWIRCITVLRSESAATCVIEQHYVCLDLRGETAAFNSQLDAPVESAAIRLHFFGESVVDTDLTGLTGEQQASYLGYIVCRRPGSPPVGRTLIKTPSYVDVSAQVVEHVNFFGQSLQVRGVPFMQQDERYAVCAHTAAWTILYSSHRKNIIERKLISDVVSASSPTRSMHPAAPAALTIDAVQTTIQQLGLHFSISNIFDDDRLAFNSLTARDYDLSKETLAELSHFGETLAGMIGYNEADQMLPDFDADHIMFISELWKRLTLAREYDSSIVENEKDRHLASLAMQLVDFTVFSEAEHHIKSGFPIYCHTADHAMTLCGYSGRGLSRMYYFHDDQYGPYLASDSIVAASKDQFRIQSHSSRNSDSLASLNIPNVDYATPQNFRSSTGPPNRGVISMGLAGPPRLLLSPSAALRNAKDLIANAQSEWASLLQVADRVDDNTQTTSISDNLRTSLVMGIDYKKDRLKSLMPTSKMSVYIASLHLAEWVVLVEMLTDDYSESLGDFVYDGTSSTQHPLLQSAIHAGHAISRNPVEWPDVVELQTESTRFPALEVPQRVGKN